MRRSEREIGRKPRKSSKNDSTYGRVPQLGQRGSDPSSFQLTKLKGPSFATRRSNIVQLLNKTYK